MCRSIPTGDPVWKGMVTETSMGETQKGISGGWPGAALEGARTSTLVSEIQPVSMLWGKQTVFCMEPEVLW